MHHDYQRPFSSDEIDEQLKEGVDCECLFHEHYLHQFASGIPRICLVEDPHRRLLSMIQYSTMMQLNILVPYDSFSTASRPIAFLYIHKQNSDNISL